MLIKKYTYPFFLLITIALILSSCDNQLTQPEVAPPLLDIPASGLSPLPDLDGGEFIPSGVAGQEKLPPAFKLLKKYAEKHPEDPYVAVVGVWNDKKQRYQYKALPLKFPDSMYTKTQHAPAYYRYRLSVEGGRSLRNLAALVPASQHAVTMMTGWLQLKNQTKVRSKARTSSFLVTGTTGDVTQGGSGDCPDTVAFCGTGEEITVTANREVSNDGFDDWPEDDEDDDFDGSGGGSDRPEDSGECPLNCYGGGGGNGSWVPSDAPAGVPQNYYDQLNDQEKQLCHENSAKCIGVYHAQSFARNWASEQFPAGGHNDTQDALRHTMWNAKMAYAYGENYAEKWGDAHEINPLQPLGEKRMDLHNNAVGRAIGGPAGRNLTHFSVVEQRILDALNNDELCLFPGGC